VKPSYILKVTYPIATVMAKIHGLAVAMRAPRSMVLAVCDRGINGLEEQCQIFKNELNRGYDRMPSPIENHILLRKLDGDNQKPKGMIPRRQQMNM
jgi:hypothetical protein